jgi:mono/diheme cytochrome c family protein
MKKLTRRSLAALSALCLVAFGLVLGGCGGGSAPGTLSTQVVSGVASVGATLTGQVSLKDSSATPQQKSTVIGSDGSFAIDVTGMTPPFILQASGTAGGTSYTLHSFAAGPGTANVNPLSNALVASAAGVNDPAELYNHPEAAELAKVGANIPTVTSTLMVKIQPLLKMFGAETADPVRGPYMGNHSGLDGMFDSVTITLANGVLTIVDTKTGAVIFTAQITDLGGGRFSVGSIPAAPTAAPAAPMGVMAAAGAGQVTLSWSPVANATSYNVYYSTTAGVTTATGKKIANATSPYAQSGLAAATTYYYVVTAVNSAGESAPSAQVSATTTAAPPAPAVPAAPMGVMATGGTKQVTVTWQQASGAASYNIYWSTTTGVTTTSGTKIAGATSPAVQTGLGDGTAYYYVVTAVNAVGESKASVQVAATTLTPAPTPTVPAAPTGVTATGGASQVTVSWPAVSGATSYNLYWSTTTGVTTATGTKIAGATNPYVQTGLAASTAYYYVVTAVNGAGEGPASAQVTATTAAPALDGAALYTQNCSGCHGPLATSSKRMRTAAQIQAAISSNTGGMSFLSALTAAQIQAIATALNF